MYCPNHQNSKLVCLCAEEHCPVCAHELITKQEFQLWLEEFYRLNSEFAFG